MAVITGVMVKANIIKTLAILALLALAPLGHANDLSPSTLREYMDFTFPVHVDNDQLNTDQRLGGTLISTLTDRDSSGEIVAGLARRWKVENNVIDFSMLDDIYWSNGEKILLSEIVESLRETIKRRKTKGYLIPFSKVETNGESVRLTVADGFTPSQTIFLLTGYQFGISKIVDGKPINSVTSGPYFLKSASKDELHLVINKHWFEYGPGMFEEIRIRKAPANVSPSIFLTDPWPNLLNYTGLIAKAEIAKLPKNFQVWTRNYAFLVAVRHAGRRPLKPFRNLIGYIAALGGFSELTSLVESALPANQIIPNGLLLNSPVTPKVRKVSKKEFQDSWVHPTVRILVINGWFADAYKPILMDRFCRQIDIPCEFIHTDFQDLTAKRLAETADLFIGPLGVEATQADAYMKFTVDRQPPTIPSDETKTGNFRKRFVDLQKKDSNNLSEYTRMLVDAVEGNYILPIMFTMPTAIGRPEIDFSGVSRISRTPPYYRLRIKK